MKKFVSCLVVDGDDNIRGKVYIHIQVTEGLEIEKLWLVSPLEEDGKKHKKAEGLGNQVVPAKKKLACPVPGCESLHCEDAYKYNILRHNTVVTSFPVFLYFLVKSRSLPKTIDRLMINTTVPRSTTGWRRS